MGTITQHIKKALGRSGDKAGVYPEGMSVTDLARVKQVVKPWGFELWLADGSNGTYAFKIIHLKKGAKTSLQYHEEKAEHNCLLEGTIQLHYKDQKSDKIVQQKLSAVQIITVDPPTIHRIEALTDVLLVETSTHHVDDVVRIEDDFARGDGKIEKEHVAAKSA